MKPSDAASFRELLAAVHMAYRQELSEAVLSFWWGAMRPFDLEAVRDALNRHAVNPDNGQFLPKPADVVKLIAGGTQDAALQAWAKVMQAVRTVGTYRSVVFDDVIVQAVVHEMGGWIALGQIQEDELPFRGREFENRYRGHALRSGQPSYPAILRGIVDRDNAARGFGEQPPVLIGNPARAQLVIKRGGDGGTLQVTEYIPDGLIESREPA